MLWNRLSEDVSTLWKRGSDSCTNYAKPTFLSNQIYWMKVASRSHLLEICHIYIYIWITIWMKVACYSYLLGIYQLLLFEVGGYSKMV
jgi:hypothetical protein